MFDEFLFVITIFLLGASVGFWGTVTQANLPASKFRHMEQKCKEAKSMVVSAQLDWGFVCANGLEGELE